MRPCRASPRSTRLLRRRAPRDGSSSSSSSRRLCAQITGMEAATLQPAAGAAGELTGLLLMRAYHDANGESERRRRVIIPDSAHGTNPASVTLERLRGRHGRDERAGRGRPRRAARVAGRRRGGDHAHEPQHPRPVRGGHRRDRRGGARRRWPALLRRCQPERDPRDRAAGRHGLRHRAPERAQDLRHPARRGRAGGGPGGRLRQAGSLPARARGPRVAKRATSSRRPSTRSDGCTPGTATPSSCSALGCTCA